MKVLLLILVLAACAACETTTPAQRQAQAKAQAREFIENCKAAYATGIGKPVEQWTEADKAGFRQAYFQVIHDVMAEQQARFAQQEQTDQIVRAINNRNNYQPFTPYHASGGHIFNDGGTYHQWNNDGSSRTYFPDGNGGYIVW